MMRLKKRKKTITNSIKNVLFFFFFKIWPPNFVFFCTFTFIFDTTTKFLE